MPDTTAAPIYWRGPLPEKCDICSGPFRGVFVDGLVQGGTRWANMHPGCHRSRGVGLGPARGQEYRRQKDGRWLKSRG